MLAALVTKSEYLGTMFKVCLAIVNAIRRSEREGEAHRIETGAPSIGLNPNKALGDNVTTKIQPVYYLR